MQTLFIRPSGLCLINFLLHRISHQEARLRTRGKGFLFSILRAHLHLETSGETNDCLIIICIFLCVVFLCPYALAGIQVGIQGLVACNSSL